MSLCIRAPNTKGEVQATNELTSLNSPLKPEELQVLRGQYEKEGEYVGIQTKFNYAWVCSALRQCALISPRQRAHFCVL